MANFFKDYQREIREKRLAEIKEEQEQKQADRMRRDYLDGLKKGAKVKYSICINTATGEPIISIGYLTSNDPESDYIWIANSKQRALQGYGATVSKSAVII